MVYADPEQRREWSRGYMREYNKRPEVRARQTAAKKKDQRRYREWFDAYRATLSCADCGDNRPVVLEFHHLDPSTKEFVIAGSLGHVSFQRFKAELAKCVVLCANCHLVRHAEMRAKSHSVPGHPDTVL